MNAMLITIIFVIVILVAVFSIISYTAIQEKKKNPVKDPPQGHDFPS